MPDRWLSYSRKIAWGTLLFLLPITSMPLIRMLVRSSTVASPTILPLLFLVIFWLLPFLLRRGRFPAQALPLLGFALVSIIASAAAFFLPMPSFKDFQILPEEITGFITLLIGLCYYLVAATLAKDCADLEFSLRWINWGGLLLILWSLTQSATWYLYGRYPEWLRGIQDMISLGPLIRQRPTGFAFEPSWLAHQLNMLYLPLWLSASIRRTTVHRRFSKLTFENLLLAGGVIVLLLSFSRVGLISFITVLTLLFVQFNLWLVRWIRTWLISRSLKEALVNRSQRVLLSLAVTGVLLLAYGSSLFGGVFILSRIDWRMKDVFNFASLTDSGILHYANLLQFGDRVIYWEAGWEIFDDHPWLGVGLGNAGFYMPQKISSYGWQLVEVRRLFYRTTTLLNTKNLWVRILAETGLLGFAFFVAWLYLVFVSSGFLRKSIEPIFRLFGDAGLYILLALLFEGFSVDSFAFPYFWISFGLVTAAARLAYFATPREGRLERESVLSGSSL